jgi:hypothetical protein
MGDRYTDVFRSSGLDEETMKGGLSVAYFTSIPNASTATDALDIIMNPAAVALLGKVHTEEEINAMKRATFRSCIAFGVSLPSRAVVQARMLGVLVPS